MNGNDRNTEARLVRLASQLGEREAAGVDAQRTAWAVMARLRSQPAARRAWWSRMRLVPLAAGASLVLAVGLGIRELTQDGTEEQIAVPIEFAELPDDALQEVLDSLALDAPVSDLVPVALNELTESELTALLETMEG